MNIFERLKSGEIVSFADPDYPKIGEACTLTRKILLQVNSECDTKVIRDLLSQIFEKPMPETSTVFPPFHTNYGRNITIGENVFINHGCSMLDLGGITIEDGVMIAPRVNIATEEHPLNPAERQQIFCKPVRIGKNAWIGTGATILAGVTVGENSVVAAGAVVTQDVPDNVVVGGIPAKIIKKLQP